MKSLKTLCMIDNDNSIPMLLDKYKTILIVEGLSDKKFYRRLFPDVSHIHPAAGKANVMRMMASIQTNRRKYQVYALVDRDYQEAEQSSYNGMQIVCTDAQCMETMIWMTDEQSVLLGILCEVMDINSIDNTPIQAIYHHAYHTAYSIGLLRYLNTLHGWNLNFKHYQLSPELFDDTENLIMPLLIPQLIDGNSACPSPKNILDAWQNAKHPDTDLWNIMQGHDLSAAFIFHCKRNCALFPPDRWDDLKVAVDEFESRARTAANITNLKQTDCCRTILAWSEQYKEAK